MTSKTKIKERARRKRKPGIVEAVRAANKNPKWEKIARSISGSRQNYTNVNLDYVDRNTKEGDTVVIVGKILGTGTLTKKIKVCAIGFSKEAREKIKKSKSEAITLLDEIKSNPNAGGIKILR